MCHAEEQRNKFAAEHCVQIIQQMVLLAGDARSSSQETVMTMPLLPVATVLQAVQRLPGPQHDLWSDVRNGCRNCRCRICKIMLCDSSLLACDGTYVWQVLGNYAVAAVMVEVHDHALRAALPRHRLRAMAPLRALLLLLGDRVLAPATFTYAVHILLQLMMMRYADRCSTSCLHSIGAHYAGSSHGPRVTHWSLLTRSSPLFPRLDETPSIDN